MRGCWTSDRGRAGGCCRCVGGWVCDEQNVCDCMRNKVWWQCVCDQCALCYALENEKQSVFRFWSFENGLVNCSLWNRTILMWTENMLSVEWHLNLCSNISTFFLLSSDRICVKTSILSSRTLPSYSGPSRINSIIMLWNYIKVFFVTSDIASSINQNSPEYLEKFIKCCLHPR